MGGFFYTSGCDDLVLLCLVFRRYRLFSGNNFPSVHCTHNCYKYITKDYEQNFAKSRGERTFLIHSLKLNTMTPEA
jgi:hypothetical protein